ncbi:MAG: hypothetical protein INR65_10230, partial [Gluconacetobacter diazotrophicus]|nr:hypothetical protein [Gluconacetobacter diazotrophicus]
AAVGPEVWQVDVGDRVAVNPKPRWIAGPGTADISGPTRGNGLPGSLVEIAELDAACVVRAPGHLGWKEFAAIPVVGATAWQALEAAPVGAASTVVLLGTGGCRSSRCSWPRRGVPGSSSPRPPTTSSIGRVRSARTTR